MQTIAIGCDHGGYAYKDSIIQLLKSKDITVHNFGTNSPDSVDYPDFVHPVAEEVTEGKADLGIILCGSGNGAAMTANKHPKVRAALCWTAELASLGRQHNNANVLSIPARFVSEKVALEMVEAFITSDFEGGRHARRVDKIAMMC
jgi:ribose 5-phosphate isomerase B